MTEHISTRKKLTDIATVTEFEQLLDLVVLTHQERKIMRLHYLEGLSLMQIGFEMGYAEITICKKHKKILQKIAKVLK